MFLFQQKGKVQYVYLFIFSALMCTSKVEMMLEYVGTYAKTAIDGVKLLASSFFHLQ